MTPEDSKYIEVFPNYRDNIEERQIPFYHTDLSSIIENIDFKEKPEKNKNILEKLFTDKSKTRKATVKALLEEIELRENLDTHLINKIEEEISIHNSHLLNLDNLRFYNNIDLFKDMSKVKMEFENNILELKKEKRKEYLECWRDLMFLKKYLLAAFKEYWDLIKKREVLSCDVSELLNNENNK